MPVTYQPYKSMFVDFKSPEISAMLNKRYLENYTAQTEIQDQLSALKAAPFEGDQKARRQLIEQTQGTINKLTERGDYENLTMPVMQAAQTYSKQSKPIQQNYEAYQSYAASLKEDYDKDRIDYEDYMGTLNLASENYSGLQFDAQGNAINTFRGLDPVYNPNIQERMDDALNGIVAEEFGMDARIVGMDTTAGTIQVMKEGKVKTVSSDRVTSVMNMVMSDPQVTSYLDRKGAIQAMGMSEEGLAKMKITRMGQIQQDLSRVQEEIGKTKDPEERAQLESMAANLLTNAGTIEGMNTPEQLRAWAATERAKQIEGTYRNAAQSRYGYYSKTVDTQIAPEWMQAIAGNGGLGASSIYTAVPGALTAMTNPDGMTLNAISGSIAGYSNTLAQLEDPEYMNRQYGLPLSGSEVLNMSAQDFQQRFPSYDMALFSKAKAAVTTATAMKVASEKRIEEVRRELNLSVGEELSSIRTNVVGAAEALDMISSSLKVDEAQALDIFYAYINDRQNMLSFTPGDLTDKTKTLSPEVMGKLEKVFGASNKMFSTDYGYVNGRSLGAIHNEVKNSFARNNAVIDEYLEQNSTTVTSMPVMTTIPFYMSDTERKNLTGFLASGNAAIASNAYLDATGNMVSFDLAVESVLPLQPKSEGFDTGSAELISSAFAPYNLSGTGGTMQMQYKDKNDVTVTVAMPFSAIDNPGINRYEGSEFNKFATIVGTQRARNIQDIVVAAYDANNNRFELKINMNDGGANTVIAVDAEGNEFAKYDFDTMLKPGGPIDNLVKRGGRLEFSL